MSRRRQRAGASRRPALMERTERRASVALVVSVPSPSFSGQSRPSPSSESPLPSSESPLPSGAGVASAASVGSSAGRFRWRRWRRFGWGRRTFLGGADSPARQ